MSVTPRGAARLAVWALRTLDVSLNTLTALLKDPALPFPASSREALAVRLTEVRDALRKEEARLRGGK